MQQGHTAFTLQAGAPSAAPGRHGAATVLAHLRAMQLLIDVHQPLVWRSLIRPRQQPIGVLTTEDVVDAVMTLGGPGMHGPGFQAFSGGGMAPPGTATGADECAVCRAHRGDGPRHALTHIVDRRIPPHRWI